MVEAAVTSRVSRTASRRRPVLEHHAGSDDMAADLVTAFRHLTTACAKRGALLRFGELGETVAAENARVRRVGSLYVDAQQVFPVQTLL
jgi:hypothetical protein